MNKFKMWHLAIICVAVFLVFGIIATAVIASNKDLHDTDNWGISWDESAFGNFVPGRQYKIDTQEEIDSSDVKSIYINCISASINIIETEGNDIKVHFYGDYKSHNGKLKLIAKKSGSTAKIEVDYPKMGISYSTLSMDIEIPKGYSKDIEIHGVSSDIYIETPATEYSDVRVDTVSGNMKLNEINADSVSAASISGNLYADYIGGNLDFTGTSSDVKVANITGEVKLNTVSGSLKFQMDKPYDVSAKTVSGDVTIELDSLDEFYVDFSSVSGDFDCNVPLILETNKRGNVKGYYESKNSVIFEVDTTSGDFSIEN